jgi:chitinase
MSRDLLLLSLGLVCSCGPATTSNSDAGTRWLIGYYAGYDQARLPVAEIDWPAMTHLAVAFYIPDGSGGLDESLQLDPVNGPALAHSLVDGAHAHGLKTVASIGGAGRHDLFASSASTANRAAFVARVVRLVRDYGYDGVDLDWEPISAGDGTAIVALAQDLRAALPAALLTLPIAQINPNNPRDVSYLGAMASTFDRINVMSYGMSGAYAGWKSWHSSPLHWNHVHETPAGIDVTVEAVLASGVPSGRLGIGSGSYGLCYGPPVTGPVQSLGSSTIKDVIFQDIIAGYLTPDARQWDDAAKVPYLSFASPSGSDGCTFISYEDEQSLGEKTTWARAQGLGAVIVWTMNQEYLPGAPAGQRHPLLDALHSGFPP